MADALAFVSAAESALGWPPGAFQEVYRRNQREIMSDRLEEDVLATAVIRLVKEKGSWRGPAADLLVALDEYRPPYGRGGRELPTKPNKLSAALQRLKPLLHEAGIACERGKTSERNATRFIVLHRIPEPKATKITRPRLLASPMPKTQVRPKPGSRARVRLPRSPRPRRKPTRGRSDDTDD